jgi:hypothetical protein
VYRQHGDVQNILVRNAFDKSYRLVIASQSSSIRT